MKLFQRMFMLIFLTPLLVPPYGRAGEADVTGVKARQSNDGKWSFSVTVRHDDEGWDHYADRWEITGLEGEVLGTRVLYHPHVGEQPFTRSLGSVEIPDSVNRVLIRAHDSVHGYGGGVIKVLLPDE